jgi:hypothetical protein
MKVKCVGLQQKVEANFDLNYSLYLSTHVVKLVAQKQLLVLPPCMLAKVALDWCPVA